MLWKIPKRGTKITFLAAWPRCQCHMITLTLKPPIKHVFSDTLSAGISVHKQQLCNRSTTCHVATGPRLRLRVQDCAGLTNWTVLPLLPPYHSFGASYVRILLQRYVIETTPPLDDRSWCSIHGMYNEYRATDLRVAEYLQHMESGLHYFEWTSLFNQYYKESLLTLTQFP